MSTPTARALALSLLALTSACGSRCPDTGFVGGPYSMRLDSQATTTMPGCVGIDSLSTGMSLDVQFDQSGQLAASCNTWIESCAGFTSPTAYAVSSLGGGLAHGEFPRVLGSGCSGSWDLLLGDIGSDAHGTTPVGGVRSYFFTRAFAPDDTGTCHTQFGAFTQGTAICADTWAVHLTPAGI